MTPRRLPEDFRSYLDSLGFGYDEATGNYATDDLPGVTIQCLWMVNLWTYNRMTLFKSVGVSLSGDELLEWYSDTYTFDRRTGLMDELLCKAGYDPDVIVRRRRLRALIA